MSSTSPHAIPCLGAVSRGARCVEQRCVEQLAARVGGDGSLTTALTTAALTTAVTALAATTLALTTAACERAAARDGAGGGRDARGARPRAGPCVSVT